MFHIIKYFLIFSVLFSLPEQLPAMPQSTGFADDGLPRVGKLITTTERHYFALFPGLGYIDSISCSNDSMGGTHLAIAEGNVRSIVKLDQHETRTLSKYLLEYESLGQRFSSMVEYVASITDTSHVKAYGSLSRRRVIPQTVTKMRDVTLWRLRLYDGEVLSGRVLALDDSLVALWTDEGVFDWHIADERLRIIHVHEIDSVLRRSRQHSWRHHIAGFLLGSMVGMAMMSESERNSSYCCGNEGTILLEAPLLSALLGYFTGLFAGNIWASEKTGISIEDIGWEALRREMAEQKLYESAAPEVTRRLADSRHQQYERMESRSRFEYTTQTDWNAPFIVGIELPCHVYLVKSRPWSVLPGLWAGWCIPLHTASSGFDGIYLMPRVAAGFQYIGGGAYIQIRPHNTIRLSMGVDVLHNRDDLGVYSYSFTTGGSKESEARLVQTNIFQQTFITFGVEWSLTPFTLGVQIRGSLQASIASRTTFFRPWDPVMSVESGMWTMSSYPIIAVTLGLPFRF